MRDKNYCGRKDFFELKKETIKNNKKDFVSYHNLYQEDGFINFSQENEDACWVLIGEYVEISRATRDVGLDDNVLRPADIADESQVIYPSSFCKNALIFLEVVALLKQREVNFRLYMSFFNKKYNEHYMLKVFPEPGAETKAVLSAFHPNVARHLSDLQERIPYALDKIIAEAIKE